MASPDIIDLTTLLSPISDESPTGNDIRLDSSPSSKYQLIKSARTAARAAERQSIHDGDNGEADEHWRKIISLAPDILANQSKDLEIATWFTEALIRRHGFQGLRDAFKLIHGLLENFWDNLYPMPDEEDGMKNRTSPLSGLNGEGAEGVLIPTIRKVPLTEGHYPGPYSFWQYQQAVEAQRGVSDDVRASKIEKLGFSLDDIEKAVGESSDEFFINQLDDVTVAISFYRKTGELLDQLCGPEDAPSTRNIVDVLEECRSAITHIGKNKLPLPQEDTPAEAESGIGEASTGGAAPAQQIAGAINSREAAFKQLLEISKFFRKTEPHSPVSYVLEKAVKWGNMPLNELIAELIPDSSSRERYSELTGVKNED
jgi:type VI secretion system protein ImpA